MNKELRGTIKTLQDNPLVKSGSYEFIGDSNITYADIYILLEFIRNQEQENKKYKEVINKAIKYIEENKQHEYRNGNLDEYYLELNEKEMTELLDILKEVEHE